MCSWQIFSAPSGRKQVIAPYRGRAGHEARIGDIYYEDIESAFQNVQAGETITVLKDCSVSGTLRVIREFRQDMAECARLCRRLLHHGERNGFSE